MAEESNELMLRTEVGALLRVSERTVTRMISDGRLPVVRVGKRYLVRRDAVMAMIEDVPPGEFGRDAG